MPKIVLTVLSTCLGTAMPSRISKVRTKATFLTKIDGLLISLPASRSGR